MNIKRNNYTFLRTAREIIYGCQETLNPNKQIYLESSRGRRKIVINNRKKQNVF